MSIQKPNLQTVYKPKVSKSLLVYKISWYPIRSESTQYVILGPNEDRMTQWSVAGSFCYLYSGILCQVHLVFVLNVPTKWKYTSLGQFFKTLKFNGHSSIRKETNFGKAYYTENNRSLQFDWVWQSLFNNTMYTIQEHLLLHSKPKFRPEIVFNHFSVKAPCKCSTCKSHAFFPKLWKRLHLNISQLDQ